MVSMTKLTEALKSMSSVRDMFPAQFESGMFFTVESNITGKITNVVLDVTEAQVLQWVNGAKIQDAMPQLSAEQRELLLTGISSDEWSALFAETETSKD